jgi:hypothetical protein
MVWAHVLLGNEWWIVPKAKQPLRYTPAFVFISRNLTPRANGLPANLTYSQFRQSLRHGTDFKNRHPEISPLLQVMPWPVYGQMTEQDLRAVYEFLRAIPSLPSVVPSTP